MDPWTALNSPRLSRPMKDEADDYGEEDGDDEHDAGQEGNVHGQREVVGMSFELWVAGGLYPAWYSDSHIRATFTTRAT